MFTPGEAPTSAHVAVESKQQGDLFIYKQCLHNSVCLFSKTARAGLYIKKISSTCQGKGQESRRLTNSFTQGMQLDAMARPFNEA